MSKSVKDRFSLRNHLLPLFLLFVIGFLSYWRITSGFFEQDEWHTFSYFNYLLSLDGSLFWEKIFSGTLTSHYTPFSTLLKLFLYKNWGLTAKNFYLFSIFGHILVSSAVYFLLYKLFKEKWLSFLGSLFFLVNSSHHQAVTWLGTFEGTQMSTLFGILGIVFALYFRDKKNKTFLFVSIFSFLISLLFKETGATFLLAFLAYSFMEKGKKAKKNSASVVVAGIILYTVIRIITINPNTSLSSATDITQNASYFHTILYNLFVNPLKVFTQSVFPNEFFINIAQYLQSLQQTSTNLSPPWGQPESVYYDLLTSVLGVSFYLFVYKLYKKNKHEDRLPGNAVLGILIGLSSLLPLLAVKRFFIFLDSRFIYTVSVGASIVLVYIVKSHKTKKAIYLFFALIVFHLFFLQIKINEKIDVSQMRRAILTRMLDKSPVLLNKSVFYVESDSKYYGLEGETLPFQSGVGNVLLVVYGTRQKVPVGFYENYYFWNIKSQGYEEVDGFGFGYFRDFERLKQSVEEYNIPTSSVFAFSWQGEIQALDDISEEIREKL